MKKVSSSAGFTPVNGHYGRRREGKLQRFRDDVLQMRGQGKTYKQIYEIIHEQGYTGTVDGERAGERSSDRATVNDG